MNKVTQGVQLNFRDDPELYDILNTYRKSRGITWKRLFLTGVAEAMAKQGENTDVVLRIVEYIEGRR